MTSFGCAPLGARRGAHCASEPQSGLSRRIWWLRKAVCITSQPLRQATGLPPPLTQGRLWRVHSAGALRQFGLFASGGALFTAEKCRKRAGGCGPRSPVGPRGVHPRKRHCPGRYAPPGCPVPYCLPLPGFARASRIGWLLRLQRFSLRPLQLPRNTARHRTQQFLHAFSRCT